MGGGVAAAGVAPLGEGGGGRVVDVGGQLGVGVLQRLDVGRHGRDLLAQLTHCRFQWADVVCSGRDARGGGVCGVCFASLSTSMIVFGRP